MLSCENSRATARTRLRNACCRTLSPHRACARVLPISNAFTRSMYCQLVLSSHNGARIPLQPPVYLHPLLADTPSLYVAFHGAVGTCSISMRNFRDHCPTGLPPSAIDSPWQICLCDMLLTLFAQRYASLVALARRLISPPHRKCGAGRHSDPSVDNGPLPLMPIDWA
jgi:hypothetical protein